MAAPTVRNLARSGTLIAPVLSRGPPAGSRQVLLQRASCFFRSRAFSSTASDDDAPPPISRALREAVDAVQAVPRGSEDAASRCARAFEIFETAMPELLEAGECLKTLLRMPMAFQSGAERPIKRLLLELSRRLRRPQGLHVAELPSIPVLLQRLGLQDHEFFEDFCSSCASSWQELSQAELVALFRGAENYALLHPTKGTALCRLVASFSATLGGTGESAVSGALPFGNPKALAALCYGALAPKSRAVCMPLLEQLRVALQASVEGETREALAAGERVALLSAAGELHQAVGVPTDTLSTIIELCRAPVVLDASEASLAIAARACGRLCWVLPDESRQLFQALLPRLGQGSEALRACRRLPASLRSLLASEMLAQGLSDEAEVCPRLLLLQLQVVHDLPAFAAASGDMPACKSISAFVKNLVLRSLDEKVMQNSEAAHSVWVSAYLAASTTHHALSTASEADSEPALADLASSVLDRLEGKWSTLRALEVQTLFRSPGETDEVALRAGRHVDSMQDPATLAALLQAAQALPDGGASLVDATSARLKQLAEQITDSKKLGTLEASLRKGVSPLGAEETQRLSVRTAVRDRLFAAVLREAPAWNLRPARGFIRYVEQSLERGRRPEEQKASASSTPVEPQGDKESHDVVPQAEVPQSEAGGVHWHYGVQAWEVKLEVGGRHILGGYFKPQQTDSPEALESARLDAVRCWQALEQQHYGRATP